MTKQVTSTVVEVTPEMAVQFLANNPNNRPINRSMVTFILRQMEDGQWSEHVSPIVFNERGELLDGQTRLSALVRYGKPLLMELKRNVPDSVMPLIDTGRKRQSANWLQMLGFENATTIAGAAKVVLAYDDMRLEDYYKRMSPSNLDIAEVVKRDPHIVEYSRIAKSGRTGHLISPSLLAGMSSIFHRSDPSLAHAFCVGMGCGYDPRRQPNFFRLREVFSKAAGVSRSELTRTSVLAYCIKAWNATKTGCVYQVFRWSPGVERFPSVM